MRLAYVGSGPYCYANSLAMVIGASWPGPSVIEVLTGSPFGAQLLDGTLPYFDPPGWNPSIGLDNAIEAIGWACARTSGGSPKEAINRLSEALRRGPVIIGPLEIGLLLHHPGSGRAIGADHYVVALDIAGGLVQFHDPDGFPFALLPVSLAPLYTELAEELGPAR